MAPRKRGGRGISFIFCCFRNNDHPEITYRLRNDSNFALQTMEPALPMPPVEELDVMFTELVVSLQLASCQWLGARRKRRGCAWFRLVSHGLALLQCNDPFVLAPQLWALSLWRKRKKKVALLHQRALL